jgi:membrane associated rhomboid family serine protease
VPVGVAARSASFAAVSEHESEQSVVSLAERRARREAEEAEARRRQARQQARREPGQPATPRVTYVLIGLNLLVWVVMVATGVDPWEPSTEDMLAWGADFALLTNNGQWWRMFTAIFLHHGILHLGFNLYFLWAVGRLCEQVFGHLAYGVLYVGTGLIASLASLWWHPLGVSVGASGALFGVFGAFLGFALRRREMLTEEYIRQVMRAAIIMIGLNVVIGLSIESIDLAAHLAGLAAGFGLGYLISMLAERPVSTPEQAKAVKLRAIAAAAGVITVVVVGGSFALPRWDDPDPILADVGERYARLMTGYEQLDASARADLIETELLPLMGEARAELAALDRMPPELDAVVDVRERFFEIEEQAFALELEGLRNEDEVALAEAENLHADAAQLLAGE